MNTSRTRKASAFTLIELLVATAITAVLMTLMVAIIASISKNWNTTSGKLTSEGEARLVLDQLTQDLQSAIYRNDGNIWMAATILPDSTATSGVWNSSGTIKPTGSGTVANGVFNGSTNLAADPTVDPQIPASESGELSYARFGVSGVCLQFFTNQPGTNTAGNTSTLSAPVAVCYRLIRQNITSSTSAISYMLYRGQVSSQDTFTNGYNLSPSGVYGNPVTVTSMPPTTTNMSGNATVAYASCPPSSEMLAQNIVDFGIRMYIKETNPTTGVTNYRLVFPAQPVSAQYTPPATGTLYPVTSIAGDGQEVHYSTSNTALASNTSDYYSTTFPNRIDVMIRVLTQEGVKQLALFENPPTGYTAPANQTWWSIVQANSVVYTRSIQINAQPF